MGIAFKDLKAGSYYKGYHLPAPNGAKCFYYVTQTSYLPGQNHPVLVEVLYILRHQTAATTWSPLYVQQGLPDSESLLKQEVRFATLRAENLPLPKPFGPPPTSPTVPATTQPVYAPISDAEAAALARAKRNIGKVAIPENARSARCVKCHGVNRVVELFQFTSYFCAQCEPE